MVAVFDVRILKDLERRWFVDPSQCWNVTQAERAASDTNAAMNADQPRSVDIATFSGPLILIGIGLVLSAIIAVVEIIYYRKVGQVYGSSISSITQPYR